MLGPLLWSLEHSISTRKDLPSGVSFILSLKDGRNFVNKKESQKTLEGWSELEYWCQGIIIDVQHSWSLWESSAEPGCGNREEEDGHRAGKEDVRGGQEWQKEGNMSRWQTPPPSHVIILWKEDTGVFALLASKSLGGWVGSHIPRTLSLGLQELFHQRAKKRTALCPHSFHALRILSHPWARLWVQMVHFMQVFALCLGSDAQSPYTATDWLPVSLRVFTW